jgi:hypothetical protein
MSLGMIMAVAAASVSQFECDVMSYDVLEPAKVSRATLQLEYRGELTNVTLTTMGVRSLSGVRRSVKSRLDSEGVSRLWPVSMKTEAGNTIELDLVETQSTHANTGAALLIRQGGDFTVGNLAENDESFVAVGICTVKRDVPK